MGRIKCLNEFFVKALLCLVLSGSIFSVYSQEPEPFSPADTLLMYLPEGAPDKLLLDSLCLMNASLDSVLNNLTSRLLIYRELFAEIWNQDDTTRVLISGAVPNFLFEKWMINRIYGYLTLNGKRVYVLDNKNANMSAYFKKSFSSGYVYWEVIKKEPEHLVFFPEEPRWWYFIQNGKVIFDFSDFTDGHLLPEKPPISK